jgi:hypothetical protein
MPKAAAPGADIIVLPKKLRAEWTDVMALDLALSPLDFRVACVIGRHFNRKSGEAFPGQKLLARLVGVSDRAIWKSIQKLEERGYLIVERRSLGEITRETKHGPKTIKLAGGRGTANTYRPAFNRSNLSATNSGAMLEAQCDHYWKERSNSGAAMVEPQFDPTLKPPSEVNLTRVRAHESWGEEGQRLRARLGDQTTSAWFGGSVVRRSDGGVVLAFARAFVRDEVRNRFRDVLDDIFGVPVDLVVDASLAEKP